MSFPGSWLGDFVGTNNGKPSSKPLRYPLNTAHRSGFIRFNAIDGETLKPLSQDEEIELQLPQSGLKYADAMNFENEDMGIMRGAMISGVDQASADAAGQAAADFFNNIGNAETRRQGIATLGAMAGINVAKANSRTAPNPNTRAFFKSPNIREFSFDWKLIPTSPTEADVIRDIIKVFRKRMYPERLESGGKVRIGYKFPAMFEIEIFLGDEAIAVEPFIKPCFLKAVNVNFNSSTGAIMAEKGEETGKFSFSEVDMTLSFLEEVSLTSEDIEEGY